MRSTLARAILLAARRAGSRPGTKVSSACQGGGIGQRRLLHRIHGPTLLIEFDNTQNDANHIHSVWRDPRNDFGADLLRAHDEHGHRHG